MKYSNGDQYNGAFESGKKNGKGIYRWKSGDKYNGNWTNDQMEGTGTYIYLME